MNLPKGCMPVLGGRLLSPQFPNRGWYPYERPQKDERLSGVEYGRLRL